MFWQLKGESMYDKTLACESCNAEFVIKHDMLEQSYMVSFCPFCGEDILIEEEDGKDAEW
tara:strand:- start:270 stop:449 length:180 start_codon:yes stop_codon:yes gene_type:complete